MRYFIFAIFILMNSAPGFSNPALVQKFDHEFHETKVFSVREMKCQNCHNMAQTESQGKLSPLEALQYSTFRKPLKQICHDCHQNKAEAKAPQTCFTCHNSQERLLGIKPLSHKNGSWKSEHAATARADSSQCLNCHSPSQCVKCHSARNPIMNSNHSRNYKFFHSIEARMSPQKCDSCHTQNYCIRCHIGGGK